MQLANEKFKKFTDSMEKNKTGLKIQTTANIFAINPENQTTLVYQKCNINVERAGDFVQEHVALERKKAVDLLFSFDFYALYACSLFIPQRNPPLTCPRFDSSGSNFFHSIRCSDAMKKEFKNANYSSVSINYSKFLCGITTQLQVNSTFDSFCNYSIPNCVDLQTWKFLSKLTY